MARNPLANPAKERKHRWDEKLRERGHQPMWHQCGHNRWRGACSRCGGEMECGSGPASGALRIGPCRPQERPRLLRLITGGR